LVQTSWFITSSKQKKRRVKEKGKGGGKTWGRGRNRSVKMGFGVPLGGREDEREGLMIGWKN